MKLVGKIICLFKGHRRGKLVRVSPGVHLIYACPRCGRETRYKVKPESRSTGVPTEGAS